VFTNETSLYMFTLRYSSLTGLNVRELANSFIHDRDVAHIGCREGSLQPRRRGDASIERMTTRPHRPCVGLHAVPAQRRRDDVRKDRSDAAQPDTQHRCRPAAVGEAARRLHVLLRVHGEVGKPLGGLGAHVTGRRDRSQQSGGPPGPRNRVFAIGRVPLPRRAGGVGECVARCTPAAQLVEIVIAAGQQGVSDRRLGLAPVDEQRGDGVVVSRGGQPVESIAELPQECGEVQADGTVAIDEHDRLALGRNALRAWAR